MLLKFSKWDINTNIPFQAADSVSKLRFLVTFFFLFSGVVYACILNIVNARARCIFDILHVAVEFVFGVSALLYSGLYLIPINCR